MQGSLEEFQLARPAPETSDALGLRALTGVPGQASVENFVHNKPRSRIWEWGRAFRVSYEGEARPFQVSRNIRSAHSARQTLIHAQNLSRQKDGYNPRLQKQFFLTTQNSRTEPLRQYRVHRRQTAKFHALPLLRRRRLSAEEEDRADGAYHNQDADDRVEYCRV
jgi:hypothetical protein